MYYLLKKTYLKVNDINPKTHNLLQPILHRINTRYTKISFIKKESKKTTSGRHFEIIGTNYYVIKYHLKYYIFQLFCLKNIFNNNYKNLLTN